MFISCLGDTQIGLTHSLIRTHARAHTHTHTHTHTLTQRYTNTFKKLDFHWHYLAGGSKLNSRVATIQFASCEM
jgi:hypothetical protein